MYAYTTSPDVILTLNVFHTHTNETRNDDFNRRSVTSTKLI